MIGSSEKVKKVGIMNYLMIEDRHAAKYVHDGLGRRGFLGWDGLRKTFLSFHLRRGGGGVVVAKCTTDTHY